MGFLAEISEFWCYNPCVNFELFQACKWRCVIQFTLDECGCSFDLSENAFPDIHFSNNPIIPICSPLNMSTCLVAHAPIQVESCQDSCLPPCESVAYEYQISSARLPPSANSDKADKMSFVVNMGFNDFQGTFVTEMQTMTMVSVIGNLGGVMGVFLGVSLITVFELFSFCFGILSAKCLSVPVAEICRKPRVHENRQNRNFKSAFEVNKS